MTEHILDNLDIGYGHNSISNNVSRSAERREVNASHQSIFILDIRENLGFFVERADVLRADSAL